MNKRKRVSLSVRLQPYSNTLLAEVADWLNSVETDEKNRLIADAIVMAYLPYARASQNASASEISRCCWETQNMLDKHGFNLRQALQVSQPQLHSPITSQQAIFHSSSGSELTSVDNVTRLKPKVNDEQKSVPQSLIEGDGEENNDSLFADDEFD